MYLKLGDMCILTSKLLDTDDTYTMTPIFSLKRKEIS